MKKNLYENRFLSEGYPDLDRLIVEHKASQCHEARSVVSGVMEYVDRLIDTSKGLRTIVAIGCGPAPQTVRNLLDRGYDAIGIEPVPGLAAAARAFLGDDSRVLEAVAESLPFDDESQRIVLFESVIEHVDSPAKSLAEAYRVLCPGGVLFVSTNNRLKFSITGRNAEYRKRFYNWFPAILKECYVHHHLHFDPRLANYTPRPAVHWFSFAELCELGRSVGFARFYSRFDLLDPVSCSGNPLKRAAVRLIQRNPIARALALTQAGISIIMLKRGG